MLHVLYDQPTTVPQASIPQASLWYPPSVPRSIAYTGVLLDRAYRSARSRTAGFGLLARLVRSSNKRRASE